jgi:hypothetical protein
MPTECSAELFEFAPVERRTVVAGFDGGAITSDGRCRQPGKRISAQIRRSMRCRANRPCTSADDAERRHGAAAAAGRQRCRHAAGRSGIERAVAQPMASSIGCVIEDESTN